MTRHIRRGEIADISLMRFDLSLVVMRLLRHYYKDDEHYEVLLYII